MACPRCGWRPCEGRFCPRCGASVLLAPTGSLPPLPTPPPPSAPPRGGGPWVALLLIPLLAAGGWFGFRWWQQRPLPVAAGTTTATSTALRKGAPIDLDGAAEAVRAAATRQSSSVVSLTVVGCGPEKLFNGVVVGPDLVLTADHFLDDTATVAVKATGRTYPTAIIGRDPGTGIGLLRTGAPLAAPLLSVVATPTAVGEVVGAVGNPDEQVSQPGLVRGLGARYSFGGRPHTDIIEVDGAPDQPTSGSPLIDSGGRFVGLVTGHNATRTSTTVVLPGKGMAAAVERLSASTRRIRPALTCANPIGPKEGADPEITIPATAGPVTGGVALGTSTAAAVTDPLTVYFRGINEGRYADSLSVMTPSLRSHMTLDQFTQGTRTSFDSEFVVTRVRPTSGGYIVSLTFMSLQDPAKGPDRQGCNRWAIDYTLLDVGGRFHIDKAKATGGGRAYRSC